MALTWQTQLRSATRRVGESCEEFVDRLTNLTKQAYPGADAAARAEYVNQYFVLGQPRDILFELMKQDEANLTVNILRVKRFEMASDMVGGQKTVNVVCEEDPRNVPELGNQPLGAVKDDQIRQPGAVMAEFTESMKQMMVNIAQESGKAARLGFRRGFSYRENPRIPEPYQFTGHCFQCGREGHMARECRERPSGPNNEFKRRNQCFKCGKPDHFARECPLNPGNFICHRCQRSGHIAAYCKTDISKMCTKCSKLGHLAASCWRRGESYDDGPRLSFNRAGFIEAPQESKNGIAPGDDRS